jgi:OOP family OmpA-OmpF porin
MRYFLPYAMLIVSICASILPAEAEPYIGLGIGAAFYKADLSGLGGNQLDESNTGTKLYAGYAFNKYFAAEAGVYNFAEASAGGIQTTPGGSIMSAAVSMKGVGAYAVGVYPVNRELDLMAKIGVLDWDADLRVDNKSITNNGTDAAYAIAASFAFTKELLATVEYEIFNSDNPELSMFSAGFRFNFR